MRIVYVSPLKALSYDIERNLRAPLQGIGADLSVGLRTGDTPQSERRAMRESPPDILITTPESLYLMLSSGAREILTGVEAVIVDEIHAVRPKQAGLPPGAVARAARRTVSDRCGTDPPTDRAFGDAAAAGADREIPGRPKRECEIVDAGAGEGARPSRSSSRSRT